jgi:hypothetical protein
MAPPEKSEKATRVHRPERVEKQIVWLRPDELVALRVRGAKEQKSEAAVVREAVRRHLGLEKRKR